MPGRNLDASSHHRQHALRINAIAAGGLRPVVGAFYPVMAVHGLSRRLVGIDGRDVRTRTGAVTDVTQGCLEHVTDICDDGQRKTLATASVGCHAMSAQPGTVIVWLVRPLADRHRDALPVCRAA